MSTEYGFLSRVDILRLPVPVLEQGEDPEYSRTPSPGSPTLSNHRIRWSDLIEWTNFHQELRTFMSSLPPEELGRLNEPFLYIQTLQHRQQSWAGEVKPTNEGQLSSNLDSRYVTPHNDITGRLPSLSQIRRYGTGYGTFGRPDYLFTAYDRPPSSCNLHAILELKTFWKVTPELINELFHGRPLPMP